MGTIRALSGYLLLVVTALGWAGAWLTAKVAAHDAPPLTVTVGRFLVAALALLPAWWVLDRRKHFRPTRREWLLLLGMSLSGIIAYTVLFLVGVALAPASDGAVITPGLAGLFAMLVAFGATRVRPGGRALLGALLSLIGVALVGLSAVKEAGTGSTRLTGDLVFVASAATWGVYTVLGKRLSDRVPAVTGILLASALGVALLTPVALAVDGVPDLANWSRAAVVNVLYLGLVATAIAFVTFYLAVRTIGIDRTAPALGLVPFFGVLGAAALLDERLTLLHGIGGALVIAGIVVPTLKRRAVAEPLAVADM